LTVSDPLDSIAPVFKMLPPVSALPKFSLMLSLATMFPSAESADVFAGNHPCAQRIRAGGARHNVRVMFNRLMAGSPKG
jgi:hypothetical protein